MVLTHIALAMIMQTSHFGTYEGKPVTLYTLKNRNGMTAKIMNYGATVVSLTAPDRKGKYADVTLGFDGFDQYPTKSPFFGAIVGRVGNRIAKGKFKLDGKEYSLAVNNGPNSLHGGVKGFDKRIWTVSHKPSKMNPSITFKYVSADMEEGYPGELTAIVKYTLTPDNAIRIDYHVKAKKHTIANLTNHTYWNLGGSDTILDHKIQIMSNAITPVDETLIPTGKLMPVANTPFDFTKSTRIGNRIDADNEQIKFGGGYDHNFVVKGQMGTLRKAAAVHEPKSGRYMEVWTTEPGIQFYSGNFLDGTLNGKGGKMYPKRGGFCLETQHFPDSVNQPNFPKTDIKAGHTYTSTTIYKFKTK
jgi:aldose 1-epimerase